MIVFIIIFLLLILLYLIYLDINLNKKIKVLIKNIQNNIQNINEDVKFLNGKIETSYRENLDKVKKLEQEFKNIKKKNKWI